MWSVTRENLDKTRKVNVNFTIDKHLYEQFKRVAQKDIENTQMQQKAVCEGMCSLNYKNNYLI